MLEKIDRRMNWRVVLGLFLLIILLNIIGINIPDILEEMIMILLLLRIYLDLKRRWYEKRRREQHVTPKIEMILPMRAVFILFFMYYMINKLPVNLMNFGIVIMLGYIGYLIFYESRRWFN